MGAIRSSDSQQSSTQDIWGGQSGYLTQGYGQAGSILADQRSTGQALGQQGQGYQGGMEGLAGQLQQQYSNPYAQQLGNFNPSATGSYANAQNPYAMQQVGQLGQNLGQFFREQLNPSITGSAVGVGGLGGSRQGIAQGMGVNSMMQQFQQGATGIMNNAYNTGANMATNYDQMRLSGMGQAGTLANQNQALNQQGLVQSGQMYQNAFNMGGNAMNAAWGPLSNYMQAIGGPIGLTQSRGDSSQTAVEVLQFGGGG